MIVLLFNFIDCGYFLTLILVAELGLFYGFEISSYSRIGIKLNGFEFSIRKKAEDCEDNIIGTAGDGDSKTVSGTQLI